MNLFHVLNQLESTSSRNMKENILATLDEQSKDIIYMVYNPYIVFGIGEKSLAVSPQPCNEQVATLKECLDYLKLHNTGSGQAVQVVVNYLATITDPKELEWTKRIILKDLKIGVGVKTVNKVFPKFVPEHNVTLLSSYEDNKDKLVGKELYVSKKYDGVRAECFIPHEGERPLIMSRQGQVIEGCDNIFNDMMVLSHKGFGGYVLSVELLRSGEYPDHRTQYSETMKELSSKKTGKDIVAVCFDVIPVENFMAGGWNKPFIERHKLLHNMLLHTPSISSTVLVDVDDQYTVEHWLGIAKSSNWEGLVVNIANAPYECKRTRYVMKSKCKFDFDLRIVNMVEGTGKCKGKLGKLEVEYKGNVVGVGTGFTDKMREAMWNNKNFYIGKIAKVSHCGESQDSKTKKLSLRHPAFEGIRWDKDEPSLY